MNFTFFTLGGCQFWEDVFISRKWRIQRSLITKKCRLLDTWDIRRANGSFENCLHCFEKYVKIFQLSPPKKKAVIMIHGLCGNKKQFDKMAKYFESSGYEIIAVNYPSTRKNLDSFAQQFDFLLNNLENIEEISFIAYGLGGLLLRKLMISSSIWRKKIKINRIVLVNTPNNGLRLWEKFSQNHFIRLVFGPVTETYSLHKISKIPQFPKNTIFAIVVVKNKFIDIIKKFLPYKWVDLFPKVNDSFLTGANNFFSFKTWHFNPLKDEKTIFICRDFLDKRDLNEPNVKK